MFVNNNLVCELVELFSLKNFFLFAVPPDILDYPTSTDMVVREGSNVSLRCAATGSPDPSIAWRRENGESIPLGNGQEGKTYIRIFTRLTLTVNMY